ncbi:MULTISPECIES: hypothetical protein [unclassified Sphingomonas]|uniref:hypothetical protein n=1 Tax=unclassified Sphingomonas TaxID=196159 RepID=UPI00092CBF62|nr:MULTISPECIES: hypothetical protein [unclassified Sphingomonas]OJU19244.1 MAG: hypothetical protein BGN95_20950 [Sphingomonas sp. 66-10]
MLRLGPMHGAVVVVALPLFEEANRTRAAAIDVLRRLAERGIGGALPDLPGTGESLIETRDATLADWRDAFADAAASLGTPAFAMSWRGGALVDNDARLAGRWHLAPLSGTDQRRELDRLRKLGGDADYAGNLLSPALLDQLAAAAPLTGARVKAARLEGDPRPADVLLSGRNLWRASEPAVDPALQEVIATDLANWIAICAG